jgi:hypothetical protein
LKDIAPPSGTSATVAITANASDRPVGPESIAAVTSTYSILDLGTIMFTLVVMVCDPKLATQYGILDGDWVKAESRRGNCTLKAAVVTTIRPDTVFIP